jgi:hypothetical protein
VKDTEKLPDQSWRAVKEAADRDEVVGFLNDEVFKALGLGADSIWRKWFGPALVPFIRSFANVAESFDLSVAQRGFRETAQIWLDKWTSGLCVEGQSGLPQTGPLLVAANHPGTFDSLAVAGNLPREDLKIVAAANPVFRAMPNTRDYFVYSTLDTNVRMTTIRNSLRHLQDGGALVIFSSGKLDPDPRYFPEAARQAVERWSKSLELFLKKVPETRLVVAMNSGFVAPEFLRNPLARLRRNDIARQRLAVFLQVLQIAVFNRPVSNWPQVSFAEPAFLDQLKDETGSIQSRIVEIAHRLIE